MACPCPDSGPLCGSGVANGTVRGRGEQRPGIVRGRRRAGDFGHEGAPETARTATLGWRDLRRGSGVVAVQGCRGLPVRDTALRPGRCRSGAGSRRFRRSCRRVQRRRAPGRTTPVENHCPGNGLKLHAVLLRRPRDTDPGRRRRHSARDGGGAVAVGNRSRQLGFPPCAIRVVPCRGGTPSSHGSAVAGGGSAADLRQRDRQRLRPRGPGEPDRGIARRAG